MTTATVGAPAEVLLTAEQYADLPDDGRRTELVNGKVVEVPPPSFRHGVIANRVGRLIGNHVAEGNLGWVTSNDSGVTTRRGPDTVRGPDIAYYSFGRIPADQPPAGYPEVAPELVFEVRSPSNTWRAINTEVGEYFAAGVKVVCVLDPEATILWVYTPDQPPRRLTADEELALPEVFPDFRVPVREFLG